MAELTTAQRDIIDALEKAYKRYNALVQRLIDVADDSDYKSVYDLRMAIMTALSDSLHEDVRKEVEPRTAKGSLD